MNNINSLGSFIGVLRWSLIRHKYIIPLFTILQIVLSLAIIFGLALLMGDIDETSSVYLATGAVSIGIIAVGSTLCSQVVSESKTNGIFDYQRSLPISRIHIILADMFIWGVATLPGITVSLLVSSIRFNLDLSISLLGIITLILFLVTTISIGFAVAYFLPPSAVSMVAQLIIILNLLFSPITFPASRLPEWIVSIFNVLPFVPGTDAIRSLFFNVGEFQISDLFILIIWSIICFALSLYAMMRRN